MVDLSREFIRDHLADSAVIFQRGVHLFEHGSFVLKQADMDKGWFAYEMDGNYGDYTIRIQLADSKLVGADLSGVGSRAETIVNSTNSSRL